MKQIKTLFAISALLIFSSCTKSDDNSNGQAAQVAPNGTWRVTQFVDSGNNETNDFSGYTFVFAEGGILTATRNTVTQTGSWSSVSRKFNIDLGAKNGVNSLGELTDDWLIVSVTDTKINLGDDNAASNESLVFTKN